jgi:NADH-quinone oxidoreductase subunit J
MLIVFTLAALLTVASAVGVIAFKNPIHSALSLVANLLGVAALFAALEAHFLAAVQIIVYAGAIMVLVLFMLMLLNVKTERRTKRENFLTLIAVLSGLGFVAFVVPLVHDAFLSLPSHGLASQGTPQGAGLSAVPELQGTVQDIGMKLFTEYMFLFQASGVLLMTAIAGAVMLAKRSYGGSAQK